MKKFVLACSLCLFTTVVYGQDSPRTLLWKVTKPGSSNESFLFGTFHEVSPQFFLSLSNVVSKLEHADILFVERRTEIPEEKASGEQTLWNAEKWNGILTDEQEKIFSEFVKKIEDSSFYNSPPLQLALNTTRLYLMYFCETDTAVSELMDTHIEKLAISQHKQVYSLDTIDHTLMLKNIGQNLNTLQDSLYASTSIHSMKSMLNDDLSDCDIVNTYKRFDLNYELGKDLAGDSIATASHLLTDRNNIWIQTLDHAFLSNNCFVAVGFTHLFYKQGLISQLRALGYLVTPVPIEQ